MDFEYRFGKRNLENPEFAERTKEIGQEIRKLGNWSRLEILYKILIFLGNLKSDFDRAPFKTPSLPKERSKSDKKCGS